MVNYSHSQGREESLLRHEKAKWQINIDITILGGYNHEGI